MSNLDRLLSVGSSAQYADSEMRLDEIQEWGRVGRELCEFLSKRNGFFAFESALHIFGIGGSDAESSESPDLDSWNSGDSWRSSYGKLADGYLFFAEDIFGGQFAIDSRGENVLSFDPETAGTEVIAASLDEWAKSILDDRDYLTGFPLGHAWQKVNGALSPGHRLLPRLPFVAGGKYEIANLYSLEAVQGMKFRGEIAVQIADLPDGAQIKFRVQ